MDADESRNSPCAICGESSSGYHFGVQACRACASFFRRSIAERKAYICRRENNCNVSEDGMRNCCKSCRLRRCQEAGMQRHDIPVLDSSNDSLPNVAHSSTPRDLDASLPASPKSLEQYPILSRLVCGYEHFIDAQQSLFSVEYPTTTSTRGHFIEANRGENLKLEKASMPLLYTMFDEYCDPMHYIPHEEKARIIENCWQQIGMLHRGYLTAQIFPDLDDPRIALASRIYMDTSNMRAFMEDATTQDKMDEYIRIRTPILQAVNRFIRKYKEQQIGIVDTATLICTALWSNGDRTRRILFSLNWAPWWSFIGEVHTEEMDAGGDRIQEHKEKILSEWTSNLSAMFGPDQAGIRIAKMLCLLVDLNHISNILQETTLITRIFY